MNRGIERGREMCGDRKRGRGGMSLALVVHAGPGLFWQSEI